MPEEEVIKRLRKLRKAGLTLHELSRDLDVHMGTLCRWLDTGRINRRMAEWLESKLDKKYPK